MTTPRERLIAAYRPLYLRGLLLDGQYKLPAADQPAAAEKSPRPTRRRGLLASLAQVLLHSRSKP